MAKEKYLDLNGLETFKDDLMVENYDNKILETSVFNDISDFSVLTTTDASSYNFEDATNYNLVTVVFPQIDITDDLLYMVNLKFIVNNTQKEIYRRVQLSDFIIKDDGIYCVIDATKTGVGDYLLSNTSKIDEIKNNDLLGTLFSCQLLDNYDHEGHLIVNGVNNRIASKDLVIVNGENNDVYGDTTRSLYVSGKKNDIKNNDYGFIVGISNNENKSGFGTTVGSYNKKYYSDYSTILGNKNRQYIGTYIPKSKWTGFSVNTSVDPVVVTVKFSIASEFTYLQSNLPSVGDKASLAAHTFYGVRETVVTSVECDSNNTVTISFTSFDASEGGTLQWGNYANIHGILFTTIGSKKNNSFIAGEYNSSYAYGDGILGFGNGSVGNYSFVTGRHNQVLADHASAFGWGNIVNADSGTALGSFCVENPEAILSVGNGDNKFFRSNALTLLKNGELTVAGDVKYNGSNSVSSIADRVTVLEENTSTGLSMTKLTQAEYDALSDEEKNNDTIYFVTDSD